MHEKIFKDPSKECPSDNHLSSTSTKEKNRKRLKDNLHRMRDALAIQNAAGLPPPKRKKYSTTHEDNVINHLRLGIRYSEVASFTFCVLGLIQRGK